MSVSRRGLFGLAGAGVAGVAAGVVGDRLMASSPDVTPVAVEAAAVPFYGPQQAGITTPAQDRLHFATFDVTTKDRAELVELLREWTVAAARMTAGEEAADK